MIGHSLGEITAAFAADVITLEDAMRLVAARGALMHRLPAGGAMASIIAEEIRGANPHRQDRSGIAVAAMNGPLNTVVSGDRDAVRKLRRSWTGEASDYRELQVSTGFHSPRTEPILDDLENIAGQIKHNAPKLPLISNLTGELMSTAPDKSYWRRHAREAVRFGDGMLALASWSAGPFSRSGHTRCCCRSRKLALERTESPPPGLLR